MTRDEPTHGTYPRGSGADTGLLCPQCGSTSLAANPSTGETVCEECGLVVEEGRAELGRSGTQHRRAGRGRMYTA